MTDPFTSLPTSASGTSEPERAGPGITVGDRYTLRAAVGHGGMGTVWQATDSQLGRNVAVKEVVPPPGIAPEDRDSMYQRMMREARAAASLSHPGIVQVYDVVTDHGRPWVVMELLDARSLSDVVLQDGPLAPRAVAKVGVALLGALEVAHAAGVLHRDVKPANVLVCTDGRCVLTDFGVARMPTDQQLTTPGMVLGSPHFISPERAMGAPFGPPSDLFSLGVTLYTAVEGRPPFDKSEPIATMHSVVEDPPAPPQRAGVLSEVLYGLLEKDPQRRWDATTARAALRDLLAGPLASTSTHFPTDPYSVIPAQRQPWQPATAPASGIGGRALLSTDEHPAARAGRHAAGRGPARSAPPAGYADDATAPQPRLSEDGSPTAPIPAARAETPAVQWVDGSDRARPRGAGPQHWSATPAPSPAQSLATRARRTGATGLAGLRRLPRQAQLAGVAGLAMVLLITTVWLFTGGDTEHPPIDQVVPAPSPAPSDQAAQLEVQEYAGRGVLLNYPAGWSAGSDNPELSYLDFTDPAEERSQIRVVVESWSGEARGLTEAAENTIRSNTGCAAPYERLDLRDVELAGRAGAMLEYTCGQGAEKRRAAWATFVHEGTAYSVRLTVLESAFGDHQPILAELLRSFRHASDD